MLSSRTVYTSLLALAAIGACGEEGTGPDVTAPAAAVIDVGNDFYRSIRNGSLDPALDTISVSGMVTWSWSETGAHSVRFSDPNLPVGPELTVAGSQHSVTFPATGTFSYDCAVHGPRMTGAVVVR
jgi:plastocyanin